MLALGAVTGSCGVEAQGCQRYSSGHDPIVHWYVDMAQRCRNQRPFDTCPHPARHLKTLPSDGGPARQAADSKDGYRQNSVRGECSVTKNLFCTIAPCPEPTL